MEAATWTLAGATIVIALSAITAILAWFQNHRAQRIEEDRKRASEEAERAIKSRIPSAIAFVIGIAFGMVVLVTKDERKG